MPDGSYSFIRLPDTYSSENLLGDGKRVRSARSRSARSVAGEAPKQAEPSTLGNTLSVGKPGKFSQGVVSIYTCGI